ncbi:unnamed protein product [Ophioblennius macclurei]
MADPLRRTLLAKLRGKRSRKGATLGGGGAGPGAGPGAGSGAGAGAGSAAPADGGHPGKEKVSPRDDADSDGGGRDLVVVERMSTYENCVTGGGARVRLTEQQLAGVPRHRSPLEEEDPRGPPYTGVSVRTRLLVSVPRQCRVGDSIGFGGDNSNRVAYRAQVQVQVQDQDQDQGPDQGPDQGHVALQENNANWSCDGGPATSTLRSTQAEENVLIRSVEDYDPDRVGVGEVRGPPGGAPQSPTFFPTELEICDNKVNSLSAPDRTLRYALDSEDDDYYDNEILPFYEAIRPKSQVDRAELTHLAQRRRDGGPGRGPGEDGPSAQETDRLRNQLKEAYYLLINAMNDINLDVQQMSAALSDQNAASSCSSHSRDSLCSRLSVKNMDSDSWSSGGDRSPQQVSDTDSLLLCLTGGGVESRSKGRTAGSKSMADLRSIGTRPTLTRSSSDGAIRYPSVGPRHVEICFADAVVTKQSEEAEGAGDLFSAISSEELLQDGGGGDGESSGSVNSLTGSSDSNAEASATAAASQHQDAKQEHRHHHHHHQQAEARTLNKGHGVTVNKMQEWMHKGRLLSSEMKQRIEGSALPRGGGGSQNQTHNQNQNQDQDRPGPQVSPCSRATKPVKSKQQQPAFLDTVQSSGAATPPPPPPPLSSTSSSWRPQLTTITVSKKRNWLQQSAVVRAHELQGAAPGAEEDPPPSPSPDHLRPSRGGTPRPARLQLPQVNAGEARASPRHRNAEEENDADDEGEIWYNPIPEDDEAEAPQRRRLPGRGGGGGGGGGDGGGVTSDGGRSEAEAVERGGGPAEASHGNAAHSTELHRQMAACKPAEDGGGPSACRTTDTLELPNAVSFSPPSSPNPAKKSGAINWSFPDKIKSPRTVRKISMRMKKLPELSRKLSVKGAQSRDAEPRANANASDAVCQTSGPPRLTASGGGAGGQASRNVIWRYHLDSSVSTPHSFSKKKSGAASKSASKGGYLSDGDSPELVAKSGKQHGAAAAAAEGKAGKGKEADGGGGGGGSSRPNGTELDIDAFRHYSFTEQPKCSQYISGLMSLHFYGAEDLKPPRVDSRDVYCAIQVDSVNKARTALLTCRTAFLDMDHTFNIELENAQHLKLVVFSWEPTPRRNRVCCHGTVVLPALFRVTRCHQLAVKLEPRGLIYVKLGLMEQWQNSLDGGGPDGGREPQVFGVEAWRVVERENAGSVVPLLISKCINEIEKRGCQVVGLYRLCGSAAVKKELREAFERDSHGVELCENTYPDINVITGVLKDYLRELPYPLITKQLYEAVLDAMASRPLRMGAGGCENQPADQEHTVGLLENLPEVEKMTLRRLLDHLKLVASHQEANKMTCQNLAVCFGPVLLSQRQEASCHTNRVFIDSEELASALHFKKHIEVLHYLLQLWPIVDPHGPPPPPPSSEAPPTPASSAPPLRRRKDRPQVLNLSEAEMAGVLRPKPGRLDSPSNRYAGDWSGCGDGYFPSDVSLLLPPPPPQVAPPGGEEADYDDVASEDTEARDDEKATSSASDSSEPELKEDEEEEEWRGESDGEEEEEEEEEEGVCQHILPPRLPRERGHAYQAYMKIQDISPVLSNRVNLRDLQESIDTLIGNLERELNKNKINVGY